MLRSLRTVNWESNLRARFVSEKNIIILYLLYRGFSLLYKLKVCFFFSLIHSHKINFKINVGFWQTIVLEKQIMSERETTLCQDRQFDDINFYFIYQIIMYVGQQ